MISKNVINLLVLNEIVPAEDKELYEYGLHQGFILLANIFTTIIIGWILNMIIESIVFLVAYIPLRSYTGGYHASTPFRCYILSIVMILVTLLLTRSPMWNLINVAFVIVISSSIIILFGPVEAKNKPLNQKEKKGFKKIINMLLSILLVFIALFWFIGEKQITICIILALGMVSAMILL